MRVEDVNYKNAPQAVLQALEHARHEFDTPYGFLEGILCVEDIPQISRQLTETERRLLKDNLTHDLVKGVGLGFNFFDSAKNNLYLARFSRSFDIPVAGQSWQNYLGDSFKDFEEVLRNPKYYKKEPQMIKNYIAQIKKEFGLIE